MGFAGARIATFGPGGLVSYSLYMAHGVVQPVANKLMPTSTLAAHGLVVRVGSGVELIALILIPAVFTYYVVEVPARKRLRRAN